VWRFLPGCGGSCRAIDTVEAGIDDRQRSFDTVTVNGERLAGHAAVVRADQQVVEREGDGIPVDRRCRLQTAGSDHPGAIRLKALVNDVAAARTEAVAIRPGDAGQHSRIDGTDHL